MQIAEQKFFDVPLPELESYDPTLVSVLYYECMCIWVYVCVCVYYGYVCACVCVTSSYY